MILLTSVLASIPVQGIISIFVGIVLVVGVICIFSGSRKKKKIETNDTNKNVQSNAGNDWKNSFTPRDVESCLLEQTTSYERGVPFIMATNREHELFFIYFYPNTFYIVKATYENGKLNIVYDYRRKHSLLEGFEYRMTGDGVVAMLQLLNAEVEFQVTPSVDCGYFGGDVVVDQTPVYERFISYLETYRKNINESAMSRKKENAYVDRAQNVREISDADKKDIRELLDAGNMTEAIRKIQEKTGLGLADCKKIADNPYMYL